MAQRASGDPYINVPGRVRPRGNGPVAFPLFVRPGHRKRASEIPWRLVGREGCPHHRTDPDSRGRQDKTTLTVMPLPGLELGRFSVHLGAGRFRFLGARFRCLAACFRARSCGTLVRPERNARLGQPGRRRVRCWFNQRYTVPGVGLRPPCARLARVLMCCRRCRELRARRSARVWSVRGAGGPGPRPMPLRYSAWRAWPPGRGGSCLRGTSGPSTNAGKA